MRTAAGELSDSFAAARAAVGADVDADLDGAEQALRRVQDALAAQPVDTQALRKAASDLVALLGDAAAICATGGAPTS